MKILVLMPLGERNVNTAYKIYNNLPASVKESTFMMPCYIDYLNATKKDTSFMHCAFDSMLSARRLSSIAMNNTDNFVLFGNISKDFKFDAIFSFQDAEESLPYEDKDLEEIYQIINNYNEKDADETKETLLKYITNLYEASDSQLELTNCLATADFISNYLESDSSAELEKLTKEYNKKLKEIK